MKYNALLIIMLIMGSMVCYTSCSSDSGFEPTPDKDAEMSFDVEDVTRAVTTDIDEFSVYGDMKFQSGTSNPLVIFNKTSVAKSNGIWRYEGIQYWYPKHEHSFVAISPSSALETDGSPIYSNSKLSFYFTMPTYSGIELQDTQDKKLIDVLAATHRRLYNEKDKITPITLKFEHILSIINFAPKLDDKTIKEDDYIQISKIEISGLKKRAKISVACAPLLNNSQTDDRQIEFTEQDGNDTLTITFTNPKIVENGKQVKLFADNDALVMLPQIFEDSSEATIRFTYSFKDDTDHPRQGTLSLNGREWKSGNAYTYNFTIDKMGLNFAKPTIESWTIKMINDSWFIE